MPDRIDPRDFRNALGHFATGVTIITTLAPDGADVGLTVNSFNSVSLDPPLVLWSLARSARTLPVFQAAGHFAVNVLAADQVELARRFALKRPDKFDELPCERGVGGVPLLPGCAARFQCRRSLSYEGGDHLIFVGEVLEFDQSGRTALVYHRGRYATATTRNTDAPRASATEIRGGFVNDYLLYLLARASRQVNHQFLDVIRRAGVEPRHWRVLATLSDGDGRSLDELAAITLIKQLDLDRVLAEMARDGLIVRRAGDRIFVSRAGYERVVNLLAAAKAHEADVLGDLDQREIEVLKRALSALIRRSDGSSQS